MSEFSITLGVAAFFQVFSCAQIGHVCYATPHDLRKKLFDFGLLLAAEEFHKCVLYGDADDILSMYHIM